MENYTWYRICECADRSVRHPSFLGGFRHGSCGIGLVWYCQQASLKRWEGIGTRIAVMPRLKLIILFSLFIFAAFLNLLSVTVFNISWSGSTQLAYGPLLFAYDGAVLRTPKFFFFCRWGIIPPLVRRTMSESLTTIGCKYLNDYYFWIFCYFGIRSCVTIELSMPWLFCFAPWGHWR